MVAKKKKTTPVDSLKKELRRVVLAGVGAAVLAKEGAADVARKWLEKGEDVEPQIRRTLKRISDQRKKASKKAGKVAGQVDGRVRSLLRKLPLVTKRDLADLAKRIDSLASKVDALSNGKKKQKRTKKSK